MGPIQVFVLGFEDFQATGRIADELIALSDAGTIRVIDARLISRESADEVLGVRLSDVDDSYREDFRNAARALVGLGAGGVLGGEDGAAAGLVLKPDAALDLDDFGLCEAEVRALSEELEVGDPFLLLVIENAWAAGLATALRQAGVVSAQQDYLSSGGLVALGTMIGIEVALDR